MTSFFSLKTEIFYKLIYWNLKPALTLDKYLTRQPNNDRKVNRISVEFITRRSSAETI